MSRYYKTSDGKFIDEYGRPMGTPDPGRLTIAETALTHPNVDLAKFESTSRRRCSAP